MVVSRLNQHPAGIFDSRELTFLSALIHPMPTEGDFVCRISAPPQPAPPGDAAARPPAAVVAEFVVSVSANNADLQATIDLAGKPSDFPARVTLAPGGYLVFHFSDEVGPRAVGLSHIDTDGAEVEDYSNARLQPGDVFALILLEEGALALANLANGTSASINIVVPAVQSRIADAYETTTGETGFAPDTLDVDLGGTLSISIALADSVLLTGPPAQQPPEPHPSTQ